MYCRTCELFGCVICFKSHRAHIWDDFGDDIQASVEIESHDLEKRRKENDKTDNGETNVKDRIRLLSALHSMETMRREWKQIVAGM